MFKKEVTYEDFNGVQQTETLYFNFSEPEMLKISTDEEFLRSLSQAATAENKHETIKAFEDLMLRAYGEKSSDGRRFVKNEAIRESFSQSAAYAAYLMELASDETGEKVDTFIRGIMPKKFLAALDNTDQVAN